MAALSAAGSGVSWYERSISNSTASAPPYAPADSSYTHAPSGTLSRSYSPVPLEPPPPYPWKVSTQIHSAPELVARTFGYVGAGLALTTASAVLFAPVVAPVMAASPLLMGLVGAGVMIGMMVGTVATSYENNAGVKHLWWLGFNAAMGGLVMSALAVVSTAILIKAGIVTGILAGALTTTAFLAPAHAFDGWKGPLSQFLCVLMVAGVIGAIVTAVAPGSLVAQALWSLDVWGGLLLFSAFLMVDTQWVLHKAQQAKAGGQAFDPINYSLGIYLDVINIFIRIVALMVERDR